MLKLFCRQPSVVILLFTVSSMVGCAKGVLDARNASINNGLIYAGDANEPFTGRVTNVPEATVLLNQPAIRLFFEPLRALYLQKDGLLLDRVLLSSSLCDVNVSKGVLDGDVVCRFPQSESKRYEMAFRKGKLNGPMTFYGPPPANTTVIKGAFHEGLLDGSLEVYSPKTQKLVHRQQLKDGVNQGDVTAWDDETGNQVEHASYVNGKLEGQFVRFAPDGKTLISRVTYSANLFNGLTETFDPGTGAPTLRAEWRLGKRNGIWKKWDDGKLVEDFVYQDDKLISNVDAGKGDGAPVAARDTTACERAWLAAHRKELGPDVMVSSDQLTEWKTWCLDGKTPG